jgi:hypothetical protein
MFRAILRWTFLLGAVVLFAGCSSSGAVPVSGKVTLKDGTPVTAGTIEFATEDLKMSASGDIGEDGTYTLSFAGEGDGCPPGTYKVTVMDADPPVSGVYDSPETTPLEVVVTADKSDYPLELEKGSAN